MARRRILFTLESRATYGYSKNVMVAMRAFPELELQTLVTGMHLLPELGSSIDLIRADGFPISAEVPLAPADERPGAWSRALGHGITGIADAFERLQPDIVVLSGDRVETMGCCIAAAYMTIPIAHNFWTLQEPMRTIEFHIVAEHITVIGGLMVVAWKSATASAVPAH